MFQLSCCIMFPAITSAIVFPAISTWYIQGFSQDAFGPTCTQAGLRCVSVRPVLTLLPRHGNLGPTRPDLNGSDFTQPNKEQGWVWVFKKKPKSDSGFIKTRSEPRPGPDLFICKLLTYPLIYIYIVLNPNLPYSSSASAPLLIFSSHKHSRLNPQCLTHSQSHTAHTDGLTHSQSYSLSSTASPSSQPLTAGPSIHHRWSSSHSPSISSPAQDLIASVLYFSSIFFFF